MSKHKELNTSVYYRKKRKNSGKRKKNLHPNKKNDVQYWILVFLCIGLSLIARYSSLIKNEDERYVWASAIICASMVYFR